jgi:hypothetical protein
LKNLPGRIEVTPSAELNFAALLDAKVSLKAELRRDPSFVAALREFLEGRLSELVNQANEIVSELVESMRQQWRDQQPWKGLVVIVDSLDHNRAVESEKFQQVRRALVNLFDRDYDNLRFADCRMIFTLPMYVPVTGGRVVRRVTNVKVVDQECQPVQDGIDAMRAVLAKRIPDGKLSRIFPDDAATDRLVKASGGHLRLLLMLAMEVVTQAESLPVDEQTVESAIEQVRNGMPERSDDQRTMLERVASQHDLPLETQEEWSVVATLLDQHFVLGYQNGRTWYDVHPLLRDEIGDGSEIGDGEQH